MELYKKKSKVIKLTDSSFSQTGLIPASVKSKRITMVMFFAGWCIHCQHAEPVWTKFASKAPKDSAVGVVDCVKYPELAHRMGVNSYPTIKVFNQQGTILGDYAGERDLDSFTSFAESLTSPPSSPRQKPKKKQAAPTKKTKPSPEKKVKKSVVAKKVKKVKKEKKDTPSKK